MPDPRTVMSRLGSLSRKGASKVEERLKERARSLKEPSEMFKRILSPTLESTVDLGMAVGTAELPSAERAANLAKFLKGSAVEHPVYHGTNRSFDTFSKDALKAEGGFFFSNSPNRASEYASATGRNPSHLAAPNVMKSHLSLKNPLVVNGSEMRDAFSYDGVLAKARKAGHDGVIVRDIQDTPYYDPLSPDSDVFVAFEPNQIKSATGNSGKFDPTNPSIIAGIAAGVGLSKPTTAELLKQQIDGKRK